MIEGTRTPRVLAQWLLAHESGGRHDIENQVQATQEICRKLCQHLARIVGPPAVNLLLARAVKRAQAEFPVLEGIEVVESDCFLQGLRDSAQLRSVVQVNDALATLLANFLGIVVALIGEHLTLRLVAQIWPTVVAEISGSGAQEAQE